MTIRKYVLSNSYRGLVELRGLPTGRNIIEKIGYVQVFSALVIRWFVDKLKTRVLHTAFNVCMLTLLFSDWQIDMLGNVISYIYYRKLKWKKQIK